MKSKHKRFFKTTKDLLLHFIALVAKKHPDPRKQWL